MPTARYFCALCRRHYLGERTVCPSDGSRLVAIPEDRLQPGSVVDDRYVLIDEIAVGGMASIYRAVDRPERRQVALKLLLNRFLTTPRLVDLFFQEARVIGRIRHPNVVAVYDFGRTADGYLFMAMELLRGPTLHDRLWDQPLPPFDVSLRIFFQIAEALRAAHAAGVIHADLKASNVLFVSENPEDERIKVLDFGIARLHEAGPFRVRRTDEPQVLGGTPQYMSPEQVMGEDIDPRTDLYAAGVLLFELLTGELPFDHDDPMEVCRMQREERPPRLSERLGGRRIPFAVEHLVDRLLRKDPDERLPSAERLYEEVKEILRKSGAPTQPVVCVSPADVDLSGMKLTDSGLIEIGLLDVPEADSEPADSEGNGTAASDDADGARRAGEGGGEIPRVRLVTTNGADRNADPEARKTHVTLLDVEFRGDDRPFTLLDHGTVELVTRPLVEAALTELRSAGAVVLLRDTYRFRAAFGARTSRPDAGGAAVDVALALIRRVEALEKGLRIGLEVRAGVAGGPVYHHPADRLTLEVLVRGALPDIAQRLVQVAPWGGLVVDARAREQREARLPGARPARITARRARAGVTVFTWHPQG